MSTLMQAVAPHTAVAASALIAAAWQGALLVLFTVLGLRLFPAISATARSLVWLAAMLFLVVLNIAPSLASPASDAGSASPRILHADPRWSVALAALWLALSVARALQLLRGAIALHALTTSATSLQPDASLAPLLKSRRAQLCSSPDVDRPSVIGFLSPKILLPSDLAESLSPAQLEPIVRHEMEHLRRRDDWVNLLQKLALVLFPLNPALFWVERKLCDERELACDDGVLQATGARKAYATCLTTLAEHSLFRRTLTLALAAWDKPTALERRIRRILRHPGQRMTARMTTAVVAVLMFTGATASMFVAHAPQLVSFQSTYRTEPVTQATLMPIQTEQHISLVKAAVPRRPAGRLLRTVTFQPPAPHKLPASRPQADAIQPHMTPVRWEQRAADSSQPTSSAFEIEVTYAAVRVPDGWLIIQL